MKYPIWTKILALLLAALALTAAVCATVGSFLMLEKGFYETQSLNEWKKEQKSFYADQLAEGAVSAYTQNALGNLPQKIYGYLDMITTPEERASWYDLTPEDWSYRIEDGNGKLLESGGTQGEGGIVFYVETSSFYWTQGTANDHHVVWEDPENDDSYYLIEKQTPVYTVKVWFADSAFREYGGTPTQIIDVVYRYKHVVLWALGCSVVVFLAVMMYLFFAAGKKRPGDVPAPGGLNRLPLDLYLALAVGGCVGLFAIFVTLTEYAFYTVSNFTQAYMYGLLIAALAVLYLAALVAVSFLFAFAAQVKGKACFWWRNSLLGRLCKLLGKGLRFLWRILVKFMGMLPLIWRWLLTAALMVLIPALFLIFAVASRGFGRVFWVLTLLSSLLADIGIVCYGAYAFGLLHQGAIKMSKGDLNAKVSTRYLYLDFDAFAGSLNTLAEAATLAAKRQMRSEQMKTELITNVSHDIKTPLTSVISYVDLLKSALTEQERQQYLEVLGRQSQQMKRLLEDLIEMSKATTGNLNVEKQTLDGGETVNQALGEYADRLEQADLTVVTRLPEQPVSLYADGKLTWRVLSNLLNNVVKYAQPGTRVYVELGAREQDTWISVKNISREELNISAEELMERFVRGDAARNTEGSGLGLNIAQSLMEAQGGSLELHVDGDLFKVTLSFPAK